MFGDIQVQLAEVRDKIEALETKTQQVYEEAEVPELQNLKSDMDRSLRWENDILYQKTREKCLTEGDRNLKFFHALIKAQRRHNLIKITKANGRVVTDSKELTEGAVNHFQQLFTASPYVMHDDLFEEYPTSVTNDINMDIEAIPTAKELLVLQERMGSGVICSGGVGILRKEIFWI